MAKVVPLINIIALVICWSFGLYVLCNDGLNKIVIIEFVLGFANVPFIILYRYNLKK